MPSEQSASGTERGGCAGCGENGRKAYLRPTMVVRKKEPKILCPRCYNVLDGFDLIDHERDGEQFGYGRPVHADADREDQ